MTHQVVLHLRNLITSIYRDVLALGVLAFAAIHSSSAVGAAMLEMNNPTDPPYTTNSGDGFLDVVASEVFRRAGLQLKLTRLPAERALINANEGLLDGDISRIAGLEQVYTNLVRVPEPIYTMDFVALLRSNAMDNASWAKLKLLSVAHIKGWKIFEQNLPAGTNDIAVTSPDQLFEMLKRDRVDVVLYSRWMGLAMASTLGVQGVHVAEPPLAQRDMFIYFNKKHENLVAPVAAALRTIKREGLYKKVCIEKFSPLARSVPQCNVQ